MRILAIDTSCDETAAAVTDNLNLLSNVVWSQASLHSEFGGVMPSLAQRQHQDRIEFIVKRALGKRHKDLKDIDAIAVTVGPGLAVALEVGIKYARELAIKYKKPLIPINHIESHLFSSLALPLGIENGIDLKTDFPALGLVLSGGTTLLCLIKGIGDYQILAETADDALGEALDKAARLLGFGYPGAAILEKFAKSDNIKKYPLPIPLIGDKVKDRFSYSGLKTAFVRLVTSINEPTKQDVIDLAASFQNSAFEHVIRVLDYHLRNKTSNINHVLFGGGVANNVELKKRLRKLCKKYGIKLLVPYIKKLNGDNAAMIGVCAYLLNKNLTKRKLIEKYGNYDAIDRNPKLKF